MATVTAWPTRERVGEIRTTLAASYTAVEQLSFDLAQQLEPWMDKGIRPDPMPTFETVGLMWSLIDTIRTEASELERMATAIEGDLRQVDSLLADRGESDG